MTPETKAKELYDNIIHNIVNMEIKESSATYGWVSKKFLNDIAKQCALVSIEEVWQFMKADDEKHDCCSWCNSPEMRYWEKVKEEINKL